MQEAVAPCREQALYPIRLNLRYEVLDGEECLYRGEGCTVRLSSTTVVFDTHDRLAPGADVRLSIEWPVKLENKINLALAVMGRILSTQGQHTTVEILRHEFRIRPAARTAAA